MIIRHESSPLIREPRGFYVTYSGTRDRRDRVRINVRVRRQSSIQGSRLLAIHTIYMAQPWLEIERRSTKVDSSTADRRIRCCGTRMSRRHPRFHFRSSCDGGGDAKSRNLRGRRLIVSWRFNNMLHLLLSSIFFDRIFY